MSEKSLHPGSLYLIPSALGEGGEHTIPEYVKEQLSSISIFIVENEKSARRFCRSVGYKHDFDSVKMLSIGKHADPVDFYNYLDDVTNGRDAAIISEAGCPGVADPGAEIVKLAHSKKIKVIPMTGPSSILLALMASGLNGQSFTFHGYLPIDKKERTRTIKHLDITSLQEDRSQIFIETPYRNNKLLDEILRTCHPETQLCIAVNLTLTDEYIKTYPVFAWKEQKPDLQKKPAVFILYRSH